MTSKNCRKYLLFYSQDPDAYWDFIDVDFIDVDFIDVEISRILSGKIIHLGFKEEDYKTVLCEKNVGMTGNNKLPPGANQAHNSATKANENSTSKR